MKRVHLRNRLDSTEPTILYRCYSASGELLYVGVTWNVPSRMLSHQSTAAWHPAVVRTTSEEFPTRAAARAAEEAAIQSEQPTFNIRPIRRTVTYAPLYSPVFTGEIPWEHP